MVKRPVFCFILIISLIGIANAQSAPSNPSNHQAKKWFKKGEWLNGLQLKPSKTVNYMELYKQYHTNKGYWDKAFEFLKTQDLQSLKVGRQNIDGDNVYATVQDSPPKNYDSTQWESHRKYIDLQYVIRGTEKIGRESPSKLTVTRPYAEARDLANYSGDGPLYEAVPGTFFLFFPSDAHRPNIMNGNRTPDKKIVIKIRYTE
jgi:YhcH/YjgK/YiaL family protein